MFFFLFPAMVDGRPNRDGVGGLENRKGFGALHPQFWGLEPPLGITVVVLHPFAEKPPVDRFVHNLA